MTTRRLANRNKAKHAKGRIDRLILKLVLVFTFTTQILTLQQRGRSPQNIKSPIEFKKFTLSPQFHSFASMELEKVSDGELHVHGDFGKFIYNGKDFHSQSFCFLN